MVNSWSGGGPLPGDIAALRAASVCVRNSLERRFNVTIAGRATAGRQRQGSENALQSHVWKLGEQFCIFPMLLCTFLLVKHQGAKESPLKYI